MAIPALTIAPSFMVEVSEEFDVEIGDFGGGIIPRGSVQLGEPRHRRTWRLEWKLLRGSEIDALIALNDACVGGASRFTISPPDEVSALEVRMLDDTFSWKAASAVKYSATMIVREF